MPYHVSPRIRDAVFHRIKRAEGNGRYVHVYEAAQEIQDEHPQENIALEDIVSALVECASGKALALELSSPRREGYIPLDFVVQPA